MAQRLLSAKRFLIIIALIVAFGIAMFAPLRREYTSSFDRQTGDATQVTNAHYGTPFIWLTLEKEVDANNPQKVISSHRESNMKNFAYDTAIWVLILAAGGFISHYTDTSSQIITEINARRKKA
jgi:hypothetical protein